MSSPPPEATAVAALAARREENAQACDAIASGRLSAPFPDRQLNGFSYWFVTAQYGQEPDSVHDLERWLSSELDASINACRLA